MARPALRGCAGESGGVGQGGDDAVGTLLDAVDGAGVADNTIIVFTSDNGGNIYNDVEGVPPTSNAPLRGGKATMFEGGIRVPCVVVWPGVTQPGSRSDEIIQLSDFYPTLMDGLDIDLPKDWPLDGTDIMPALKGGKLGRVNTTGACPQLMRSG